MRFSARHVCFLYFWSPMLRTQECCLSCNPYTECHVRLKAHLRSENIYDTVGRCLDAEDSVIFYTPLHISFNDSEFLAPAPTYLQTPTWLCCGFLDITPRHLLPQALQSHKVQTGSPPPELLGLALGIVRCPVPQGAQPAQP